MTFLENMIEFVDEHEDASARLRQIPVTGDLFLELTRHVDGAPLTTTICLGSSRSADVLDQKSDYWFSVARDQMSKKIEGGVPQHLQGKQARGFA